MPFVESSLILLFVSFTSFFYTATAASPEYSYHVCGPNTTTFSVNSTYQTNLNSLLTALSNVSNGFLNTTSGQGANRVYGLILCRGDISTSACQDCASIATRNIVQLCPVQREAIIWYDLCLIRYDDNSIFSTMDTDPGILLRNANNITDPQRFRQVLPGVINPAASQATSSPRRFAVAKGNFSANQLYCLVQCTPDLSTEDCSRCLQQSIVNLPKDWIGARALYPSCYSRYEMYSFFNESFLPTSSPPPEVESPLPSLGKV